MAKWNAAQYLKFSKERTQPAIDLARRIDNNPSSIIDLGCGPGNSTAVLRFVFPSASIVGIDSSEDMIRKAESTYEDLRFIKKDAREIEGSYDLIFSNACLQWIPDHHSLIPFLMEHLTENGMLAAQIPMNGEEPFFRVIKAVADEWGVVLSKENPNRTLKPYEYASLLSSSSSSYEIWETKYYHKMESVMAMIEWAKGTRLRPYLDVLGDRGDDFISEIAKRAETLYEPLSDGSLLFGFRRFFFTARR